MKTEDDHAREWIIKADSDRVAARLLIQGPGPYDTACFHIQQAVEKYLKALIVQRRAPFPRIHDLVELDRIAKTLVVDLDLAAVDLAMLTRYAVELRYSADFWPTRALAEDAFAMLETAREAVLGALPRSAHPESHPTEDA